MAAGNLFSNLFTAGGVDSAEPDFNFKSDPRQDNASVIRSVPRITIAFANSDVGDKIVWKTFQSGHVLHALEFSDDGAGAVLAGDLGLYLKGKDGLPGTVLDVDLFASAHAMDAQTALDVFTEAVLGEMDRGKRLWELLAVGAGTDTEDPGLDYMLVTTVTTALTTADKVCKLVTEHTKSA